MSARLDIIPGSGWGLFPPPPPMVIAGPCSAESEQQVMNTARSLHEIGVSVFRAGLWKPRTHPGCFEGVGAEGLPWLQRVRRETGMAVATEVATEKHVRACLDGGVDLVWIGARTTANPFLVQEIADALQGSDIPVLVKNPVNPDPDLWIGALERLNRAGLRKLGVIHRGFSSPQPPGYRNDPLWQVAIQLRTRYPEMAFFADPSHMAGERKYIPELSQRALDLGLDGLMIESHCDPSCAKSDAAQQLTPGELKQLLATLIVRDSDCDDATYKETIDQLRARIDALDENLLSLLEARLELSRQIGRYKKEHNIAILQSGRWEALLQKVLEEGRARGLSEAFIRSVFNAIHEASVRAQNEILAQP